MSIPTITGYSKRTVNLGGAETANLTRKQAIAYDEKNERKRLNASERDAVFTLAIIDSMVAAQLGALKERMKTIPNGPQAIGMLRWASATMLERIADTIPVEQLLGMRNDMHSLNYVVGVRRPGGQTRDKDYGMWISWGQLAEFFKASHEHCMSCQCDTQQQMQCSLRRQLDMIPNDVEEYRDKRLCPYKGQM